VDRSLSFRELLVSYPQRACDDGLNVRSKCFFLKDEKDVDVLQVKAEVVHKSPSQRMRSVIFLMWKQTGEELPFEVFYHQTMERIIDHLKSKLPPISF
jgi:hypothetical protein